MHRKVLWIGIFMLGSVAVSGIEVTSLLVPPFVRVGESVRLECVWKADRVPVYTVKWYFGSHEFYRWTPAEKPPVQVFGVSAFVVDRSASDSSVVVLKNVTMQATGFFKCEVSGEKPAFPTDHQSGRLEVVDPPKSGPYLTGLQNPYSINDFVTLNCSSPPSRPPVDLTFYVNGEPVDETWILSRSPEFSDKSCMVLRFTLRSRLVERGPLTIRCSASIPDVYYNSVQVLVESDVPFQTSMEGRTSQASCGFDVIRLVASCLVVVLVVVVVSLL